MYSLCVITAKRRNASGNLADVSCGLDKFNDVIHDGLALSADRLNLNRLAKLNRRYIFRVRAVDVKLAIQVEAQNVASDDLVSRPNISANAVRVDRNVGGITPAGGGAHIALQEDTIIAWRGQLSG